MKLRSSFLIITLVITFTSLATNYIQWSRASSQQSTNRTSRSSINISSNKFPIGIADQVGVSSELQYEGRPGDVQDLAELREQKNYAQIALLLNEMDMPKDMIQMYIYAQIKHDLSMQKINENGDYWKPAAVDPLQLTENLIETNNYKREQLRAIFGDDIENDVKFKKLFKPYDNQLDFLSSRKQVALQNLKLERMSDIQAGNISRLNQTTELDSIKNLLGDDDFNEYQLRESHTAKYLIQELDYFDYSEQEYRELFTIRQQFEKAGRINNENALTENDKVREYLGDERYEEYQRAKQPAYKKIRKIAKDNNISESNTLSAYQTLSESLVSITRLRQNTNLSIDERASQIELLISEAKNNVADQVGTALADNMVNQVLFSPQITRKALSLQNTPF